MNFFENQDRARRRTRGLLALFFLAVVAIILAVNAIVLLAFGGIETLEETFFSTAFIRRHLDVLAWTSLLTGGVIAFASLYRTLNLRSGGGTVARELGGTPVDPDVTDPLRRRLRNIVEEIAIASGVPVPEIYVLEQEQGLNAFAAGYSPADAAVAVTRGLLENLNRAELQGVVAHEFGHIVTGDMRLNLRLIGILFGILVMTVIGRRVLFSMRYSRNSRGNGGVAMLGIALMLIGYIGLLFGRMIKASVSRQREYLADASAVQFTRQTEGIAGALKKIGAADTGSILRADAEEVSHMLLAGGFARQIFATHPPLLDRIRAIEPGFDPAELKAVRERMQRHSEAKPAAEEGAAATPVGPRGPGGLPLAPDVLIERIGQYGPGQILTAALLAAAIPTPLERAAHSSEWAPEVVCYLLMDRDPEIRERQLLMVGQTFGGESKTQVSTLLNAAPNLATELRMPLLEITFPALRRRPEAELTALMALIDRLIHVDGRVDVFEYSLARLLAKQIDDALHPARSRTAGRRRLVECFHEVQDLLSILAHHGNKDPAAARAALAAGLRSLERAPVEDAELGENWPTRLDAALAKLDELRMEDKQRLLRAMANTVAHGGEIVPAEVELLRAVCASLHVPLAVLERDPESTVQITVHDATALHS